MDSLGQYLRRERELRQLSLEEIAQDTRIPLRMLQHLEDDKVELLPGEIFARGFVKSYAKALGLPEQDALARFSTRGRGSADLAAAPIAAITAPQQGRRFGIAIALVVLLILFTLALSIVLRPRQRETPIELSEVALEAAPALRA
jgi:cytoskeletal protein RodZ